MHWLETGLKLKHHTKEHKRKHTSGYLYWLSGVRRLKLQSATVILLNKELPVQECDARGDATGITARFMKILMNFLFLFH